MPPATPHWFKLRDLLFPGSLAAVAWGLALWIAVFGAQSATSDAPLPVGVFGYQGIALLVALLLTGTYAMLLWHRLQELAPFYAIRGPYYTIMLNPGRYQGDFSPDVVIGIFQKAFDELSAVYEQEAIWRFAGESLFWVWLKPNNIADEWEPGAKVAGYTISDTRRIVAAYITSKDLLSNTTLSHEIAFALQGELSDDWVCTRSSRAGARPAMKA